MASKDVVITKKDIAEYFDDVIRHWRKKRDDPATGPGERSIAVCYVDAYQSARMSLLGEMLPVED